MLGLFGVIEWPAGMMPENSNTNDQASSAKLDMNVVCQSALAYMSFPDAASAELFVEECKEGKHPEVVEQYKAQMNISDDSAI